MDDEVWIAQGKLAIDQWIAAGQIDFERHGCGRVAFSTDEKVGLNVNESVLACVYAAINEANEDRRDLPPLDKSPDTPIHGAESGFDSLALINFIVAVEENVERDLGAQILLSDDRALAQDPSPFDSVRALVDYIEMLLSEQRSSGVEA